MWLWNISGPECVSSVRDGVVLERVWAPVVTGRASGGSTKHNSTKSSSSSLFQESSLAITRHA